MTSKAFSFTKKALKLLEEQLDLYVTKSSSGHFLSEEEISNVRTIVDAFVKSNTLKQDEKKGYSAEPRLSNHYDTESLKELVEYGIDDETEKAEKA